MHCKCFNGFHLLVVQYKNTYLFCATGEGFVKYKISSPNLSQNEQADVIQNMHNAANRVSLWKPYRVVLVYKGSIVVGALLPTEVFHDLKVQYVSFLTSLS